jgi:anti-anti-sigma factor
MVTVGEENITAPFAFRDLIEEQIGNGVKKFVVDLTQCSAVDSAGLGALVASYTKVANAKGSISLVSSKGKVFDALQVTKLFTLFDVQDSVENALKSISEARTA